MDQTHKEKLSSLGLDDILEENEYVQKILKEGKRYESMFAQLEEQFGELMNQIEECEETRVFLKTAIDAAEEEDMERCEKETKNLVQQQEKAKRTTERCVQNLKQLIPTLPENRRSRIDRFIGLDSSTTRDILDTEIDLE